MLHDLHRCTLEITLDFHQYKWYNKSSHGSPSGGLFSFISLSSLKVLVCPNKLNTE